MDNRTIARCLHEIADVLEIKGENSFRIRSYRVAAETVEATGEDLPARIKRGESIKHLPGIGTSMEQKVKELVDSGSCAYHRELLAEVPESLLDLLKLPGLGPRGVNLVWTKLGVRSIAELETAIRDGRFRELPGMKEKKEAKILKGIEERRANPSRFLLPVVAAVAERLKDLLLGKGAAQVEVAGSFRRRRESIGDLDLIAVGGDPETLAQAFTTHADVKEVLVGSGPRSRAMIGVGGPADPASVGGRDATPDRVNKVSIVLRSGLQVDLRFSKREELGAALQYFTGSKTHNVALRERAIKRGLKLNEYGLFDVETGVRRAGEREEDIYEALGLAWTPPELREGRGEIEAAEARTLPVLVEPSDVKGDLHVHTQESDGRDTLDDMIEAARRRGLEYLAITDHSRAIPSPKRGSGMDEARCLEHLARVRAAQARHPDIRLLAGIEVCILPDGRLDMADEVLAQLDVVVASLHSHFDMEGPAITDRVLRAFENPHMDIWGHPLGRRVTNRPPVAVEMETVLEAAVRRGVAIEVNCQPDRLDAPDAMIRAAAEKGARFVISTDSHATTAFDNLVYGVGQARRGWLRAEDVLNTRPVEPFLRSLRGGSEGS